MTPIRHISMMVAAALVAAACGSDDMMEPLPGGPPPIEAAAMTWTWVDFPGSACDDGSTTGIGVNLNPASRNVLVYLEGGGACTSYATCVTTPTYSKGPFAATQLDTAKARFVGGILDRARATNPVKDWNLIYVPYCTGDVHSGAKVTTYMPPSGGAGSPVTIHHVGHSNIVAYVARLAPTFKSVDKLVVSGASAGGFGTVGNYSTFRTALKPSKSYLIDDSGPNLVGDDNPKVLRDLDYEVWGLDTTLGPTCGDTCKTDLSYGYVALSHAYPSDRMSLLSSVKDTVIPRFLGLMASDPIFTAALLKLGTQVLDPLPNFKYFFTPDPGHTMIRDPDNNHVTNGVTVEAFITQQIGDDPAWVTVKPN